MLLLSMEFPWRVLLRLITLCFFVLSCSMIRSCDGVIKLPPNTTFPGVFAFGDSIVDQGNNNALITPAKCNFPPYGKDFPGGIPTGRFSNGKTPPDLIAEALGVKDVIPAYLDPNLKAQDLPYGVSFASGACGFDPLTPLLGLALSLSSQLEQFKEYIEKLEKVVGEESSNNIVTNSLYIVVAGSNDLVNTYFTTGLRRLQYDISSYADFVVSSASSFIQELHQLGARRMAVFGIPPIGCLPFQRTLAGGLFRVCSEEYNMAAKLLNSKLSPALASLTKRLPQSRVVYIEIYNPLLDLIQHPQDYGFEISDSGCCGTGKIEVTILCNTYIGTCPDDSKYIFWDSFHPTEKAYKVLIDQVLQKYIPCFQ